MSRLLPRNKNCCWVNTLGGEIPRRRWFCQIKVHKKTKVLKKLSPIKRSSVPGEGLQSWTKMDFAISPFKIEPFKTLAITNTPPCLPSPPKKTMLKSTSIISPTDWTTLTRVGWGKVSQQYQAREISVLWVRKCEILNTLCPIMKPFTERRQYLFSKFF